MLTYFDECYDNNHSFLIFGALYNPQPQTIHLLFRDAKRDKHYLMPDGTAREIKYAATHSHYRYSIATKAVDCFLTSPSFFRAIVIDQRPESAFSLDYFGHPGERKAMKEARAYKKFCELLLGSDADRVTNGVLLTDRMTRCKGDAFLRLLVDMFGTPNEGFSSGKSTVVYRHVQEVDTALEQYQVGQIGDILQGVILNELLPPRNRYKRKLREYAKSSLGLPSLGESYWRGMPRWQKDQAHPKYQIWYWRPSTRE